MINLSVCCVNKPTGFSLAGLTVLPSLHQISTLEKTTFRQYSILSSISKRPLQISPFLVAAHSTSSEVFDFHNWFSPGFSDAIEASTSAVLSLHRETKLIIGFDFAVTLSSPQSSCVLCDITSEQTVELKWPMLNKHKR